ncbi:MAG TPA: isocitrate lyase/phosphoenolpyruvate mutase family protein [Micrococcaceae bacterium]|jgi:2-methylisocitrate lyase-like PEP mutase family enzyme
MTIRRTPPTIVDLQHKAATFRALHTTWAHARGPESAILVLANAWDAASAALIQQAGATAIATTSSAISWSHGYPDGNKLPRELAIAALARVAQSVSVPVTADIEAGYADDDDGLAETVRLVMAAGAVGINLEDSGSDGLADIDEQAGRIRLVRATATEAGVDLFINARTDTFLSGLYPQTALAETLARGRAYLNAGADGLFVPGLAELDTIRTITAAFDAPVNILAGPGSPTVEQLRAAGVRRISVGNDVAAVAYASAAAAAASILSTGSFDALAGGVEYPDMQRLFS